MKKVINIGRGKSNDLVFDYQQVSTNHAVITPIGSNSLILEDLGSSNGTFVNGVQIKRMIISREDRVKVANILVNTKPYFISNNGLSNTPKSTSSKKDNISMEHENIEEQFKNLEEVWLTYQNIKRNHKKKGFWKNMGLSVAGLGFGAIVSFATGGIPGAMMIGSFLGRGAGGLLKDNEKLQVIENEFKVNYVCPKCKTFLGNYPYEALVQRKKCFTCKTNWIKTI